MVASSSRLTPERDSLESWILFKTVVPVFNAVWLELESDASWVERLFIKSANVFPFNFLVSFIAAIISRTVSVRLVPFVEIWTVPLVQPLLIPIFPAVIPVVESLVELDKRF